ncbi:sensor histidine kinase [Ferrigenium sp. UT5]|uniref:sensor histidine kinase n=1 Tax=Ferrigenium sp. UT5 TaxID=3242105 RepID=UPI0038B3AD8E
MPDFRNMGTVLRIVLLVNATALFLALAAAASPDDLWQQVLLGSALLQPVLLSALLLLYALDPALGRLAYGQAAMLIVAGVVLLTFALGRMGGELFAAANGYGGFAELRRLLLSALIVALLLGYFRWRAQALSPVLQEARLQALQARIRPHFLFNSINAVLAIVRTEPKRAEAALEDMADLFRMAMSDTHELVALQDEVALAQRYLALEQLRMGERLQVRWHIMNMPDNALIPPLVLQPLLENAVYHGIEPLAVGGLIEVSLYTADKRLHLEVQNPLPAAAVATGGNRMALANIRERLALLFDVEAEYRVEHNADRYAVHIIIPWLKQEQT